MDIKETFISLTKETYPHGYEIEILNKLPKNLSTDNFGNFYLQIGSKPSCMFTSHLDTASHNKTVVNHVFEGNIIKTDGKSILGADDKAGVTIMLYMIENNIPGLYYFFLGEERGCIGSKKVADLHRSNPIENINKVISFDRRGTDSVITFQSSQRCCSEEFATSLAVELNEKSRQDNSIDLEFSYRCDPTGIYTDSYQFLSIYPECTNISVGYQREHTMSETQDLLHLEKLCKTVVGVDWENLPVKRDPKIKEYENNETSHYNTIKEMWSFDKIEPKKNKKIWFMDKEYNNYVSYIEINQKQEITNVDLDSKRILNEESEINKTLREFEIEYENIEWNGVLLKIEYGDNQISKHKREELENYIEVLRFYQVFLK